MAVVVDLVRRHIIKCDLCRRTASIQDAYKQGWDWFTGTLGRTMHYCHEHAKTPERNRAFDKSREPFRPNDEHDAALSEEERK